jgi:hypothetical protein
MKLRREHDEFRRFDEVRKKARQVPNNLKEGYLIDYTAEPDSAISLGNSGSENENEPTEHDEGDSDGSVVIIYSS